MSYLIVFRTYPDIDHMAPLAWTLLDGGEEVHAVISPGHDPAGDHRLGLLRTFPAFHLHEVWPARDRGRGAAIRGTLRSTIFHALWLIVRHDVRVVCVEWGYGLREGYERLRSLAGVRDVARSFVRSLRLAPRRDPHQTRTNFLVAGRLLGRATVCLPHGVSIKLEAAVNEELRLALLNGGLDWRDRNRFSAYVLSTEHHRRLHLEHARGAPAIMQTWGSLRWAPQWYAINRALVAPYAWPATEDRRLRVVFMVPKWRNRVDAGAVVDLVGRLHAHPVVSLAIKGHPRPKDGSADPLRAEPSIDWTRIHDVEGVDSVALIAVADVVVDVGSSIGIEVLLQGRTLVNPFYLHEVRTLFDEIPGTCVRAASADEVVAYLEAHAAGAAHRASPEALAELMRRAVYGDRPEPNDVLSHYRERVRELATTPRS
ncbi:MAG: hypothetical protein QOG35_1322 [Solirubrobacteraceae bacterium]|nr:hypothetical protein [Solirubrobacteraceae bacterium]